MINKALNFKKIRPRQNMNSRTIMVFKLFLQRMKIWETLITERKDSITKQKIERKILEKKKIWEQWRISFKTGTSNLDYSVINDQKNVL